MNIQIKPEKRTIRTKTSRRVIPFRRISSPHDELSHREGRGEILASLRRFCRNLFRAQPFDVSIGESVISAIGMTACRRLVADFPTERQLQVVRIGAAIRRAFAKSDGVSWKLQLHVWNAADAHVEEIIAAACFGSLSNCRAMKNRVSFGAGLFCQCISPTSLAARNGRKTSIVVLQILRASQCDLLQVRLTTGATSIVARRSESRECNQPAQTQKERSDYQRRNKRPKIHAFHFPPPRPTTQALRCRETRS